MNYNNIKKRIEFFRIISIVLSVVLHPMLMPTYIFLVVFNFCPNAIEGFEANKNKLLFLIMTTTFFLPFLSTFVMIYVLKKSFSITDLFMEDRKERFYPFLFIGLFYSAITYMMIVNRQYPAILPIIMGGIALTVLIVALITYFYKISAHAVGICGALGYTLIISYYFPYEEMIYPVAAFSLLAGLLLSARLNLNAHSPGQVFSGSLIGLVLSIGSFIFFRHVGLYLLDNYYY